MHSIEALQWLEENRIIEKAKKHTEVFKNILVNCLNTKEEGVLIIGGTGTTENRIPAIMAAGYYLACKELGHNFQIVMQKPRYKGDAASRDAVEALYNLRQGSIIALSLSNRLGSMGKLGKSFRNYCSENRHRFVSSTNLGRISENDFLTVIDAMNVDYKEMRKNADRIKEILDKGKFMHITTDAGTDLRIGIENCVSVVNAGDYKIAGRGGNMPAGEVYIPPKWKEVNGVAVIDASSANRHGTQLIKNPIKITIKRGEIVSIEGEEEAEMLKESFEWALKKAKNKWGIKRACELGIGINPRAKIIGATIVDEKTIGTCHIAFGSNYWFGGTILAIIHFDQIFRNPKILVDGVELKV